MLEKYKIPSAIALLLRRMPTQGERT